MNAPLEPQLPARTVLPDGVFDNIDDFLDALDAASPNEALREVARRPRRFKPQTE